MPDKRLPGPRIGLALGSGAARGWAHLGVLRALEEMGVRPDLVTGTSAGALAGAAWLTGQIAALRAFGRDMGVFDMVTHFELAFGGGLIKADKAFARFRNAATDIDIKRLPLPFACIATDLATGRAVTLREGPLLPAVRASTAMPGLFAPVEIEGRWLSDGALVDPVPVGVARAMGADIVIGVHLNAGTAQLRRHRKPEPRRPREPSAAAQAFADVQARVGMAIGSAAKALGAKVPVQRAPRPVSPNLIETLAASIAIMQDQLSRARLAADPPDVVIAPPLAGYGILAFDRGEEMEQIGYRAALAMRQPLERALEAAA